MAKVYVLLEGQLLSTTPSGGSPRQVTVMENAVDFDFHYETRKIYWIEENKPKVYENIL